MRFLELAQKRYSCRKYADTPVEREKLMHCIEAARMAPSACNSQPWRFILVDDPQMVSKAGPLMKSGGINKFAEQAKAFIIILPDKGNIPAKMGGIFTGHDYTSIDIGIATAHLTLAAAEQGLGSCIMGIFQEKPLKELLGIPKSERIELVLALGYPASDEIPPKKRRTTEQVISFNHF